VISQDQRIGHGLEREGIRRPGNQLLVGRRAEGDNKMVVGQLIGAALGGNGSNDLPLHVNAFNCCLDKPGSSEGGADRLRAVPQFQPSRARLEKERREHEEVLAAHERDFDLRQPAQESLQMARSRDATEPAAQHDNAHCPSRVRWGSPKIMSPPGGDAATHVARPWRRLGGAQMR